MIQRNIIIIIIDLFRFSLADEKRKTIKKGILNYFDFKE